MNEFDLGVVAFILVASISIAYGIACTLVLRRLVNHEVMRAASRRFLAHLLEPRLFIDDPVLILRSQRDLIVSYFALLRALAPAAAALLMPSVLALFVLQNWFAKAPLPLDRPAVVTAHLKRMCNLTLATPPGVRIDTDALRALASNEVSWRVTPTAAVNTPLLVEGASERIEYPIVTGRSFFWRSFDVTSPVEVSYPRATIFGESWITWFVVFSFIGSALSLLVFRLIA